MLSRVRTNQAVINTILFGFIAIVGYMLYVIYRENADDTYQDTVYASFAEIIDGIEGEAPILHLRKNFAYYGISYKESEKRPGTYKIYAEAPNSNLCYEIAEHVFSNYNNVRVDGSRIRSAHSLANRCSVRSAHKIEFTYVKERY
jgi:hypothetical protein